MTHTKRRYAQKHEGYDHHNPGNHIRSKKGGSGHYNWGKLGDDYDSMPIVDKGDPMYDDDRDQEQPPVVKEHIPTPAPETKVRVTATK